MQTVIFTLFAIKYYLYTVCWLLVPLHCYNYTVCRKHLSYLYEYRILAFDRQRAGLSPTVGVSLHCML